MSIYSSERALPPIEITFTQRETFNIYLFCNKLVLLLSEIHVDLVTLYVTHF